MSLYKQWTFYLYQNYQIVTDSCNSQTCGPYGTGGKVQFCRRPMHQLIEFILSYYDATQRPLRSLLNLKSVFTWCKYIRHSNNLHKHLGAKTQIYIRKYEETLFIYWLTEQSMAGLYSNPACFLQIIITGHLLYFYKLNLLYVLWCVLLTYCFTSRISKYHNLDFTDKC